MKVEPEVRPWIEAVEAGLEAGRLGALRALEELGLPPNELAAVAPHLDGAELEELALRHLESRFAQFREDARFDPATLTVRVERWRGWQPGPPAVLGLGGVVWLTDPGPEARWEPSVDDPEAVAALFIDQATAEVIGEGYAALIAELAGYLARDPGRRRVLAAQRMEALR